MMERRAVYGGADDLKEMAAWACLSWLTIRQEGLQIEHIWNVQENLNIIEILNINKKMGNQGYFNTLR